MNAFNGPIRVSANGRHFVDAGGEPLFWLGDTAWPLFTRYTREEAEAYLSNRAAKGFTVIQAGLAWPGGTGMEKPRPLPNHLGEEPWRDGNPAQPNEAFFTYVDDLLAFAAELGLVLAVLPTWGYFVNDARVINMGNARVYGRWLGERFRKTPNLVWMNGGDRSPLGFEDVYRELGRGLREGDGGSHLITYHPCGWRSSSRFFHDDDWLDFNMCQTWSEWTRIYPFVQADFARTPLKPVVMGEGAYENGPEYPLGPITPLVARRQAWWTILAGGFHTYGQNQIWRMEPGWQETFDTPGAESMAILARIVTGLHWWNFIPDQTVIISGVGSEGALNAAVCSKDNDTILIYLSGRSTIFVNPDKIAARYARATWHNPQTGETRDAGQHATGNRPDGLEPAPPSPHFTTPDFWEDAVLILTAVK